MKRNKITVIGAGNTGAMTALMLATRGLGDVILLDIPQVENSTQGKALDMTQAMALSGMSATVRGTADYKETFNSDLIIVTAGAARKPGMTREDLTDINMRIVSQVVEESVKYSPEAILLILTNPVDIMTYVAYLTSGFPKNRVIGQAGVLDTARFRTFIAQELNVDVNTVSAYVLGVHGDEMVPLTRYTFVNGIPLDQLLSKDKIQALIERTRNGGAEIVNLLGNGSAYFAPAASLVEMAESVLLDQRRIIPGISYLEGEYGYSDIVFGVPLILGANGIERIVELDLFEDEKAALDRSAVAVQKGLERIRHGNDRKLA